MTRTFMSGKRDSNSRPQPWQGCALPTELFPQFLMCPRQESNLHVFQHSHLKRARLPFRHVGPCRGFIAPLSNCECKVSTFLKTSKTFGDFFFSFIVSTPQKSQTGMVLQPSHFHKTQTSMSTVFTHKTDTVGIE